MPLSNQSRFIKMIDENKGIVNSLCKIYYREDDDFKDCRQDVILQLWKAFPTFRGEAKISTWIYKVALNTILSKIRKERSAVQEEPLSEVHDLQNQSYGTASGDDVDEIHHLIEHLTPENRAVMILFLEGYSQKEIADTLQMTPSNVSTRLHRIKNELRLKFNKIGHGYE